MSEQHYDAGSLWFDDMQPGMAGSEGPYRCEAQEIIDFAKQWDPLPIHTEGTASEDGVHGGLIAPGTYTLAVKQLLLTRACPWGNAVIGAVQHDALKFLRAVRPGDELTFHWEVREARASRSKPDRGIVVFFMWLDRADGTRVLEYVDTVILRRRPD